MTEGQAFLSPAVSVEVSIDRAQDQPQLAQAIVLSQSGAMLLVAAQLWPMCLAALAQDLPEQQ